MSETIRGSWLLIQLHKLIGSSRILWLDEYLGVRGWGLILYGVLPSNLVFLGILNVNLPKTSIPPYYILLFSIIPLLFIFHMISNENKKWYLTREKYGTRSLTITFAILFLSIITIGLSNVIQKNYSFYITWNLYISKESLECFLSAISSLVISSSIFMVALTRKTDFPLLPTVSFADSMNIINRNIRKIQCNKIWENCVTFNDDSFIKLILTTEAEIDNIIASRRNNLAKMTLSKTLEDLKHLRKAIEDISKCGSVDSQTIRWQMYFKDIDTLKNQKTKTISDSLQRLKNLELGD